MKHLGIDFGTKKIGLAVSDELGTLARPHSIITKNDITVDTILALIHELDIEHIVIGESIDGFGDHNDVHRASQRFIQQLSKKIDLPVSYQNEWGSTLASRAHFFGKDIEHANPRWTTTANQQKHAASDDRAAAVILQRYLDRKKKTTL